MSSFRSLVLFGALLVASPAGAGKPGDATIEEPDKESGDQRIELFDNGKGETVCKTKGQVCVKAAPSGNTEMISGPAPTFKRPNDKGDWVVDVFANLNKAAVAGNGQFIFSDVQESKDSKKREVTAMYQAGLKAANGVSARVRLSTEEGFRKNRVYRLQIVQLLPGETVLAEGLFVLK